MHCLKIKISLRVDDLLFPGEEYFIYESIDTNLEGKKQED